MFLVFSTGNVHDVVLYKRNTSIYVARRIVTACIRDGYSNSIFSKSNFLENFFTFLHKESPHARLYMLLDRVCFIFPFNTK